MGLKNLTVVTTRMFSSGQNIPRVCIVGAGIAGFYAAMHLTKNMSNVRIDLLEKLPVPFGLVRYGVAPDHPEVKNVINQFTKVAQHPNVNYYGNVTLGKDVSLKKLRQHYHAVLLAYGAEEDKTLGIENEDVKNVLAARNFVGWYNGFPSDTDLEVDLSNSTAAILGQGNVALDVARILLSPIDELRKTDITEYAIQTLAESQIKELYVIGRRGPLQVAFTIKELREQLKLKNCLTVWRENDFIGVEETIGNLARPRKRLTELMIKSLKEGCRRNEAFTQKYFMPIFFRSPNKFLVNNKNQLAGIELKSNKLVGDKLEDQKCVPTGEMEVIDCGLVFRSIGYKSKKVDNDLIFTSYGTVAHEKGCITVDTSMDLAKLYVAGWLGTGPVGVILHTMGNAFHVAKTICEDLNNNLNCLDNRGGFEGVRNSFSGINEIVDWNGWEKINKYEVDQGKPKGKPREKICSIKEMLEIALK